MTALLEAALAYAALGWRVLPVHGITESGSCTCFAGERCSQPGKHPAIGDWVDRSTTDPIPIRAAWARQPRLNIGIATGDRSGFFVLDVDPKNGGDESLADLERQHGALPGTLTAITGSGGRHILFKQLPGLGQRVGFCPGLDIRGDGGQIVAAPSNHWSGGTYKWRDGRGPAEVPILEAPQWLIQMLEVQRPTGPVGQAVDYWCNLFAGGAAEGGRNDTVTRLAGYFLRMRLDPLLVLDILKMWNANRVRPPLPDKEIEITVNSVAGKELARVLRKAARRKKA